MRNRITKYLRYAPIFGIFFAVTGGHSLQAQSTPAPAIFFTDLQSGPDSGGDAQGAYSGAYVTIYGNYFGTSQGSSSVTLNGSSCARVVSWGTPWLWYQKTVIQLGAGCSSGNLVVNTSAGASNAVPFTVRAGNIYCVSAGGNDGNSGRFPSSCWGTVENAVNNMIAGDTVYVENGVKNTDSSLFSAVVNIQGNPGGTASSPIAIVAYPGATATLGDYNNTPYALRVPQVGLNPAYYVIAGLTLRGNEAMDLFQADHFWVVGNDMSCPASGISCFHGNSSTNLFVYGNNVHDISGSVKLYHAVYFTTNTNHVWTGWNLVDPDPKHTGAAGCRGIQFYSTGGSDQYDLHVHDNVIRDTICDGLNFATVNPNQGTVEAYNNSISHAGTGPDPSGQLSSYACIVMSGGSNSTVPAKIYNNSMYDCGARGWAGLSGAINAQIPTQLTNNAAYMTNSSEEYLTSGCSNISGSHNDWYGNGSAPCGSQLSNNLNVNPGFVNTTLGSINLALTSGSPLISAGVGIGGLLRDIEGLARSQSGTTSVGAYQFGSSSVGSGPTCDLNHDGVVNSADVDISKSQAIGESACSDDLNGDGKCNDLEVQRIVNAALGQGCKVGP